jgi:hypothetical protein
LFNMSEVDWARGISTFWGDSCDTAGA